MNDFRLANPSLASFILGRVGIGYASYVGIGYARMSQRHCLPNDTWDPCLLLDLLNRNFKSVVASLRLRAVEQLPCELDYRVAAVRSRSLPWGSQSGP